MSAIQVNLKDEEYLQLKEYRNPAKWQNWRELNKKQRYLLQRMIVDKFGGHAIVMEIAKEASHNLGYCKWCDHEAYIDMVRDVFK